MKIDDPFGKIWSYNITRHPTAGIGGWTDGELAYLLRTGVARDGRYTPPWMAKLPHLADEDLLGILAWLRSDDPMLEPSDVKSVPAQPSFFAKLLSNVAFKPLPYPTRPTARPDGSDPVALGRYLTWNADCWTCHSADFAKLDPMNPPATPGYLIGGNLVEGVVTPNLTPDPETGIGKLSDAELARAIRSGVMPDGELSVFMAMSVGELSDEDLVAVMSYLRSLPPVKKAVPRGEWGVLAKVLTAFGLFQLEPRPVEGPTHVPPAPEPSLERGRYLARHAAFCASCHTTYDPATFKPSGPAFGGGTVEPSHGADSDHEYAPPNLTSAPSGYVGRVSEDAFVARMRAGRVHETSIMPWECYATMTDADLRSIYRFIKTVPRVDVDTGPSYRKIGSFPPR
jgi:mono/diheme cytochrome c family protein